MNILNRKEAPATKEILALGFPVCEKTTTASGVPVYYLSSSADQVLRVEIVFNAGISKQEQKQIASAVNALLTEGTKTKTASEIADSLDFYGSYVQPKCLIDDAQLTLYCLKKHLDKCLEIVLDVISNSYFNDNEIDIYKRNNKQRLKVQQEKTSYLCRKGFYQSIFGNNSPISYFSESADYDNISRETLIDFHQKFYHKSLKYITISGDVDDNVIKTIVSLFSDYTLSDKAESYSSAESSKNLKIVKKGSSQTTLRVGRKLFNRTNADYRKLQLLNMILGGYFGSRLMKNIREDKGLTYGIYSVLESYLDDGCFYIEADVNSKKTDIVIQEIINELTILNNRPIEEKELNTAKNYLLGSILRGIDGPFSIMDRNRIIIDYGFDKAYYDELIDIIRQTTASELLDLSNKYFKPDNLVHIVCGS